MKLLTEEQKQFYDENGYILLDILTEGEIQELSSEYDNVFHRKRDENLEATWKGNWAKTDLIAEVKSIHCMELHSAAFARILFNPKLLDACEDVMSTSNLLLHHSKAHLKPPGTGAPFPMHQDYPYFPHKNHSPIAVFISMDASGPDNGGLCVYPGSHRLGPQNDVSTAPGWHYVDPEAFPVDGATPVVMKKGQVLLFSYLLVHGSYENRSSGPRRMHLIQVASAEDDLVDPSLHRRPCQGLVLRGENARRSADINKRNMDY